MQTEVIEQVEEITDEPTQVETPETKDEPKADKPNPVQKRIDELTRAKHEAEREAAFWREAAKPKEEAKEPEKPLRADFDSDDAYLDARDTYIEAKAVAKAKAELAAEQAKHTQQQAERTAAQTYGERMEAFKAEAADFDDVMQSAGDIRVSAAARDAILESELGPKLAYHLAKHPEEARRVAAMTPLAQVRELGRIEERLSVKQPAPITSKAPNPITPTRGSGGQFTKDEARMTDAEWFASRKK